MDERDRPVAPLQRDVFLRRAPTLLASIGVALPFFVALFACMSATAACFLGGRNNNATAGLVLLGCLLLEAAYAVRAPQEPQCCVLFTVSDAAPGRSVRRYACCSRDLRG